MYTPVVRESILPDLARGMRSGRTSSPKESFSLEKEIAKLIEAEGVQSDKRAFVEQVYTFLDSAKGVYNEDGSSNINQTLAKLLVVQEMVNTVKINKEAYDDALEQMQSADTGSDIALDSSGRMYAFRDDEITTVSLEEYKESPEEYRLLNNQTLLNLRNSRKDLAGRIDILHDISNAVGMKDIMTTIEDAIEAIKTQESKGHAIKTSAEVQRGLEGLYNITSEVSRANVSKETMIAAIKYLKNTRLNSNAQHVLEVNAALQGTTAENLIYEALYFHTGSTYHEVLDGSGSGDGSGTGTGRNLKTEMSFGESVVADYGIPQRTDLVLGSSLKFSVSGYSYPTIGNSESGPLKTTQTLSEAYANLQAQGILFAGKPIQFGNLVINNVSAAGSDLIINNASGGKVVYLPTNARGEINFAAMQEMQKVQDSITNDKITDPETIRKRWEDAGYEYDETLRTGKLYGHNLRPFWVQEAYTTENTETFKDPWGPWEGSVLNGNKYVEKIDSSIVDGMIADYNREHGKNKKLSIGAGWTEDSYKGLIFIPLNGDIKSAMISAGHAYIPKTDIRTVQAQQQAIARGGGNNDGYYDRTAKAQSEQALFSK